jgi:hypothetical protein
MPIQAKPLFRPDVLRPKLDAFKLPQGVFSFDALPKCGRWSCDQGKNLFGIARRDVPP